MYCDADSEALKDVIMDYFTSGPLIDSEDDTILEEQCDDSYNEVGPANIGSVDMATSSVYLDDSDINEGTNFVDCTVLKCIFPTC